MSSSSSTRPRLNFLKPADEASWTEDKPDVDTNSATTFIYNPYLSMSLEQQRKKLPIYKIRDNIIHLLEKYQTLVLVGETGCGKSTQVPQYLMEANWSSDGKMIGVTQPRRVAATTLASRVADEMGAVLGDEVGYAIRFDEKMDPKRTKIKYMTEGLLIREMMSDPLLRQYSILMLDEIHERTVNSDVLMSLLRKILKVRKDLRVIVSSATVDAEELRDYFNLRDSFVEDEGKTKYKEYDSPTSDPEILRQRIEEKKKRLKKKTGKRRKDTSVILSVTGRTHPIEICYTQEPVANYITQSVHTAIAIHQHEEPGDILIFLTGQQEVDDAVDMLKQHEGSLKGASKLDLMVLPMYGSLPAKDQLAVFKYTPKGVRKVVVATNIAETSITINGIIYVIDCGFVKMKWFNTDTFMDSLVVLPISKASAEQRAGRAGRTKPGKVYRLYPESEYANLATATTPEIQRTDLSSTVLDLKAMGIENVASFHFPSPPPSSNLIAAIELLFALGALDKSGNLTNLGEKMTHFPVPPTFSKMLLASAEYGCSDEITTIAALLQVDSVFTTPYGQAAMKARVAKRNFEVEEGDLLTLLNVYNAYLQNGRTKMFCSQNFLSYKRLRRAEEIKKQMMKLLVKFGIQIESCKGNSEPILKSIVCGFFPNVAYLHHSGYHRTARGELVVQIHPTSVLYTLKQPQWLIFNEIIHTSKIYIRDVTVIQGEWLEELVPHFYKKKTEFRNISVPSSR